MAGRAGEVQGRAGTVWTGCVSCGFNAYLFEMPQKGGVAEAFPRSFQSAFNGVATAAAILCLVPSVYKKIFTQAGRLGTPYMRTHVGRGQIGGFVRTFSYVG